MVSSDLLGDVSRQIFKARSPPGEYDDKFSLRRRVFSFWVNSLRSSLVSFFNSSRVSLKIKNKKLMIVDNFKYELRRKIRGVNQSLNTGVSFHSKTLQILYKCPKLLQKSRNHHGEAWPKSSLRSLQNKFFASKYKRSRWWIKNEG